MKTITIFLLSFTIIPVALTAQPTITNNEYYHYGDVIQMVKCNASGVNAGSAGAGVSWDFSSLVPSGGFATTTIAMDTSSVFLTSNVMATLPNGDKAHVQQSSTESYLNGIVTTSGLTTYYNFYETSRRPMTYLSNYVDTFFMTQPSTTAHGKGYIIHNGDAYGTLTLPNGTYTNVLRVKKYVSERDTIPGPAYVSSTIVTYLWFDNLHAAPLLSIDSSTSPLGSGVTVSYLSAPVAVPDVNKNDISFSALLTNNELQINGDFENGQTYEVVLINMIGSRIYTTEFKAYGNHVRFDMNRNVTPGIYVVSIVQKGDPSSKHVIKVVKQ